MRCPFWGGSGVDENCGVFGALSLDFHHELAAHLEGARADLLGEVGVGLEVECAGDGFEAGVELGHEVFLVLRRSLDKLFHI